MMTCVYCGARSTTQNRSPRDDESASPRGLVCERHADLPAIDPEWESWRLRKWWEARYTLDELLAIGGAIDLPAPADLNERRVLRSRAARDNAIDRATRIAA